MLDVSNRVRTLEFEIYQKKRELQQLEFELETAKAQQRSTQFEGTSGDTKEFLAG